MGAAETRISVRMKIAQINLQPDWGGAEKHVLLLARGLQEAGQEVRVCCHPRGGLRRHALAAGIPTCSVTAMTQLDFSAALRLAARLWRFRPDILHVHTPKDYLCGAIAARLLQPCRTVLTRHMMLPLKPMMRRIYSRADAVVCLSRVIYESLLRENLPQERLRRVRSAIDVCEFDSTASARVREALRQAWCVDSDCTAIGLVGRLVAGKGPACLLKAADILIQEGLNAKFIIAGDGPERGALQALATNLEIDDRVVFLGHCAQIPQVMAGLDISVLASENELVPLSVLEAMASSLPVVATAVGGVPEIVKDGVTGFLVPPRDDVKMAASLHRLIVDPDLRNAMGKAGRLRAEQEHDLPCMIADMSRVYGSLFRKRSDHAPR